MEDREIWDMLDREPRSALDGIETPPGEGGVELPDVGEPETAGLEGDEPLRLDDAFALPDELHGEPLPPPRTLDEPLPPLPLLPEPEALLGDAAVQPSRPAPPSQSFPEIEREEVDRKQVPALNLPPVEALAPQPSAMPSLEDRRQRVRNMAMARTGARRARLGKPAPLPQPAEPNTMAVFGAAEPELPERPAPEPLADVREGPLPVSEPPGRFPMPGASPPEGFPLAEKPPAGEPMALPAVELADVQQGPPPLVAPLEPPAAIAQKEPAPAPAALPAAAPMDFEKQWRESQTAPVDLAQAFPKAMGDRKQPPLPVTEPPAPFPTAREPSLPNLPGGGGGMDMGGIDKLVDQAVRQTELLEKLVKAVEEMAAKDQGAAFGA